MSYQGTPAKEFIDLDIVQAHLQGATQFVAQEAAEGYRSEMDSIMHHLPSLQFDSPLEALFWLWWHACIRTGRFDDILSLEPQREVVLAAGERYRVDFLVEPVEPRMAGHKDWIPLAVEVDGHAFHERTKEQVSYRDQRDRALQKAGWKVFHFSFSEFTTSPVACVAEVLIFARDQRNRVSTTEYSDQARDSH